MGLTLYKSNDLEILLNNFYEEYISKKRSPFSFEHVIVNNFSVSKWIHLKLAKNCGISSNIKFYLPAQFIWSYFNEISEIGFDESLFSKDIIFWQTFKVLPELLIDEDFDELKDYLYKDNTLDELRLYNISKIISDLYDKYTFYRYDWLINWKNGLYDVNSEKNKTINWQAKLWRKLSSLDFHNIRIDLLEKINEILREKKDNKKFFEKADSIKEVHIFGIFNLPPIFLDIFIELSRIIEVKFYVLNPCYQYWFDLLDEETFLQKIKSNIKENQENINLLHYEKGNAILLSNGKVLRDLIADIYEKEIPFIDKDNYKYINETSLLNIIKKDIFEGYDIESNNLKEEEIIIENIDIDKSIQIHVCHSKRREIEILHDVLLDLFDRDSDLRPSDILVLAPNINDYTEIIDAIFQSYDDKRYIPYSIADRSEFSNNPIVKSFFSILSLNDSRFLASEIIGLLEVDSIRSRFNINEEEIKKLIHIITDSGIRWGINRSHREEEISFGFHENSWEYGIERILLGFSFPYVDKKILNKNYPYTKISINDANLLGNFFFFLDTLISIRNELKKEKNFLEWLSFLKDIILTIYLPQNNNEHTIIKDMLEILNSIEKYLTKIDYKNKVSIYLIKQLIKDKLEEKDRSSTFFTGRVTFANIGTINLIPYKCIYLLGMNEDEFPRNEITLNFDLMIKYPRKGDRNKRLLDKQFFLNCILSADKYLIISYVGFDMRSYARKVPSILVLELIDYINKRFRSHNIIDKILIEHNIQPFSKAYFISNDKKFTYKHEWIPLESNIENNFYNLSFLSTNISKITLDEFIDFFIHPQRFFIQNQLGIYFYKPTLKIEDEEVAEISDKELFKLETLILNHILDQKSRNNQKFDLEQVINELIEKFIIENNFYIKNFDKMNTIKKIEMILQKINRNIYYKDFVYKINSLEINGRFLLHEDENIIIKLKKINKAYDLLNLWIKHLFANISLNNFNTSKLYTIELDKKRNKYTIKEYFFNKLDNSYTQNILNYLVDIFLLGCKKPIDFNTELSYSCYELIKSYQDIDYKIKDQIKNQLIMNVNSNYNYNSNDPYLLKIYKDINLLFSDEFMKLSKEIFNPIFSNLKII